ncbi:Topoisomerase DNA binding C4 zinc finger [Pseudobutyrivibrio sp. UC1225]|uniref:nuclease-related domain-containing protein n=1 Tax=Pseudobutyrivibrio sp. UC1225 TaxID=1798185 RepID=UPI0008ED2412|nr:nuclease-related domain-containing protein [Pseudobutyrivibrio sp. UC1225]SFO09332.1 Topoisomerase DNA binding C4 zinc finger [Pseudobutyrivibrio sp. UC1225]
MEILVIILLIFVVSFISAISHTPEAIGKKGEQKIEKDLNSINFWGYDGYCLRNIYVPRADGSTSEIDLLYITCKGFFVIESKNYSGYIFGDDRRQQWTSTLYAGKNWYGGSKVEKYKFYNPVWQNNTHITALKHYLGDISAISIIVFGGNCELKDVNVSKDNVYICYEKKLKKLIKKIWDNTPTRYSKEEIKTFYNTLLPLTDASKEKKKIHIQKIQEKQQGDICPRCGGTLVLRQAKNGIYAGNRFYGCSNYPKCKFIKNI